MLTNMIKKDEPVLVIPLGNDTRERPGSLSEEKVRIILLYLRPYLRFGGEDQKAPISDHRHCVKSVQIRSYFWSQYRKIRPTNNSVFGHFSRSGSCSVKKEIVKKENLS